MGETAENFDAAGLLRRIRLLATGNRQRFDRAKPAAPAVASKFPDRPDGRVVSDAIPLFFIGRNNNGFWVARGAEGRTGGIFLLKDSALRFASKHSAPAGCAVMFLTERFELDVENHGNLIVAWLDALRRVSAGLIPDYPPPIDIGRKNSQIREWK